MSRTKDELILTIPTSLIRSKEKIENRSGIVMAYCLTKRFGSMDGYYLGTLRQISNELGLHYDEVHYKNYPKQLQKLIDGLDYLCQVGCITLKYGDYTVIDCSFKIKHDPNFVFHKRFTSISFSDFDYILNLEKRSNKSDLLYTLLWVKTNFMKKIINEKNVYFMACGYTIKKMAEMMNVKEVTLYNHLAQLSFYERNGESENYESEENYELKPLCKSRPWRIKTKSDFIQLPSIYVENKENASQIIDWKRKEIIHYIKTGDNKKDDYIYDDTFDLY